MRQIKFYMSIVAVSALLFTSCSKDDPGTEPAPVEKEMATLSFNAALAQMAQAKSQATKQSVIPGTGNEQNLPECPDDVATEDMVVRVELERQTELGWEAVEKNGSTMLEAPVLPGTESDWMTGEGLNDELELEAGIYRITYFGVFGPDGDDADSELDLLYITPAEDDAFGPAHYQNFVDDALPSEPFDLNDGQKKYVDVEVLCYDEHFVQQYGYLFFDFEEVEILYLCVFGNVCNEAGRHAPAAFRFDVYNFSGSDENPKGTPLFTAENSIIEAQDEFGEMYEYAEPVCVQLPDGEGEDVYYGEIWLLNGPGTEDDELIRMGAFDENDVVNNALNYQVDENTGDSSSNYFHFREDCTGSDDSNPCLFSAPTEYSNNFDGDDEKSFISLPEIKTDIADNYVNTTTNSTSNAPNSGTMQAEGTYGFFTSPSDVHSNWIDLSVPGTGNMLIINGEDNIDDTSPYFVISDPRQLCPGADYFVTFDLINVLAAGAEGDAANDNAALNVIVNGVPLAGVTIDAPYENGTQTWRKIGLRLKANGIGAFVVKFINDENAANGNDFAIDNVEISNDPSIMTGLDQTIIQP